MIHVVEWPNIKKMQAERLAKEIAERDEYYRQHKACPKCGNTNLETTTMGSGPPNDRNHAICICGWRGRVHDLLPCEIAPCECGTHGVVYCGDYWMCDKCGRKFPFRKFNSVKL